MFARIFISTLIAILCGNSFQVKSSIASDQQTEAPSNPKNDAPAKQSDKDTLTASDAGPIVGLPDDWKQNVDVPELQFTNQGRPLAPAPASKLKLWVERGWLVVRYETPKRGLEWQVVLARATNPTPPKSQFDQLGFEITYGPYFIRDHSPRLLARAPGAQNKGFATLAGNCRR